MKKITRLNALLTALGFTPDPNENVSLLKWALEQAENYGGLEIADVEDYHQAVSLARSRAKEGDVIILSPASTSFDRFANFMERGRVFKEIVNSLK